MPDDQDDFDKAFEGFGDTPAPAPAPEAGTPPAVPPVPPPVAEPPKADDQKPAEEPKENEVPPAGTPPADQNKKEEVPPEPGAEEKPEEGTKPPEGATPPATPPVAEEPKPLTKDDVTSIIRDLRTEERTSGQALQETTQEVLEAYYPDGLKNVLIDKNTGKELKTPQDVVDVMNGEMSTEQATQWLMNEQWKLDQDVKRIKGEAEKIAETTLKFKQDGVTVLQKYAPLFEKYPQLQARTWDQFKKLVKADSEKGVILSAPDMLDFYDFTLEPYRLAFEHGEKQPGTAAVAPAGGEQQPVVPGAADRMDEGGDGGQSPVNDPNDFAQQVGKELANPIT